MKKTILVALAGLIGGSTTSMANVERANSLTSQQKKEIASAIKVLLSTDTLVESQNQCVEFDQDILDLLDSEGLIEKGTVRMGSICIGVGK